MDAKTKDESYVDSNRVLLHNQISEKCFTVEDLSVCVYVVCEDPSL